MPNSFFSLTHSLELDGEKGKESFLPQGVFPANLLKLNSFIFY
jgi:hypothetical protein